MISFNTLGDIFFSEEVEKKEMRKDIPYDIFVHIFSHLSML